MTTESEIQSFFDDYDGGSVTLRIHSRDVSFLHSSVIKRFAKVTPNRNFFCLPMIEELVVNATMVTSRQEVVPVVFESGKDFIKALQKTMFHGIASVFEKQRGESEDDCASRQLGYFAINKGLQNLAKEHPELGGLFSCNPLVLNEVTTNKVIAFLMMSDQNIESLMRDYPIIKEHLSGVHACDFHDDHSKWVCNKEGCTSCCAGKDEESDGDEEGDDGNTKKKCRRRPSHVMFSTPMALGIEHHIDSTQYAPVFPNFIHRIFNNDSDNLRFLEEWAKGALLEKLRAWVSLKNDEELNEKLEELEANLNVEFHEFGISSFDYYPSLDKPCVIKVNLVEAVTLLFFFHVFNHFTKYVTLLLRDKVSSDLEAFDGSSLKKIEECIRECCTSDHPEDVVFVGEDGDTLVFFPFKKIQN